MTTATRYIGLDIHKRHVMIAAVNDQQEVIQEPQKVSILHFTAWAQTHLYPTEVHFLLHSTTPPRCLTVASRCGYGFASGLRRFSHSKPVSPFE